MMIIIIVIVVRLQVGPKKWQVFCFFLWSVYLSFTFFNGINCVAGCTFLTLAGQRIFEDIGTAYQPTKYLLSGFPVSIHQL